MIVLIFICIRLLVFKVGELIKMLKNGMIVYKCYFLPKKMV